MSDGEAYRAADVDVEPAAGPVSWLVVVVVPPNLQYTTRPAAAASPRLVCEICARIYSGTAGCVAFASKPQSVVRSDARK